MDAIEVARQIAAKLHQAAIERGQDPWQAYQFALAEADHWGFSIETCQPGATSLNGGRATIIHDYKLILHESAGSPFDQAFLVAHEVGHFVLGDGEDTDPATHIDPARAAEASPIGIDRVTDYSHRQRREVQMDLFAREFLLPRAVARKLHLEERLTASAIAERLGAPFAVVAQQLFDALLLPPIELPPTSTAAEKLLNGRQAVAARHRGKPYLLEAGPGTGKTQTLAARVEGLLKEGVDPRRILLLTFSNKAAGEMAERLARKNQAAAAAMWIGTFHAFGLDIIRRFHTDLGFSANPLMMDRTEAAELLEHEFARLRLKHYRNLYDPTRIIADILSAISRAKDEVIDHEQYSALAEKMEAAATTDKEREIAQRAGEVARVYELYEYLKKERGRVDFGDLVSLPVRLLEQNAAIRTHLQGVYDHVLIDEYQDVNRSSVRLLQALCPAGQNLWAVGDAKQSIYRFRGASSYNMSRFGKQDFPGGQKGRLRRNYRSTQEIVSAFSTFAVHMQVGDRRSALTSEVGPGGSLPDFRRVTTSDEQTVAVADAIQEMRSSGFNYRDQAVFCTGNEKLSELGQHLERLGIPVLFLGNLFERQEIKELLSLLTILADRRAMGLALVGCMPPFAVTLQDVANVVEHLGKSDGTPAVWLGSVGLIPGLSSEGKAGLGALGAALQGFSQNSNPWDVVAAILLDRTRIAAEISISTEMSLRARGLAIWQFMNFLRVQPPSQGAPIPRLIERVRRLIRLAEDRDLRQLPAAAQGIDAVRLMTIHGSKGLEFPVVHFPGLNEDTLPGNGGRGPTCIPPDGMIEGVTGPLSMALTAQHLQERECLFYVGLSRAKTRLILYAATLKSNGHTRAISSFLNRLDSTLLHRDIRPSRVLPSMPDAAPVSITFGTALKFSAHELGVYEKCRRRFFYTYILRLGGRRTTTPFMQMHDAVRKIVAAAVGDPASVMKPGAISALVDRAIAETDLTKNGYVDEYRSLSIAMIDYYVKSKDGRASDGEKVLTLNFGGEEVIVKADEVLIAANGAKIVRQINTGHKSSKSDKDVTAAAFMLAAQKAFPAAQVELVYLSDEDAGPVNLGAKALKNRSDNLGEILDQIRGGAFPADASAFTCPNCPSFFICGPVPAGPLKKIFK